MKFEEGKIYAAPGKMKVKILAKISDDLFVISDPHNINKAGSIMSKKDIEGQTEGYELEEAEYEEPSLKNLAVGDMIRLNKGTYKKVLGKINDSVFVLSETAMLGDNELIQQLREAVSEVEHEGLKKLGEEISEQFDQSHGIRSLEKADSVFSLDEMYQANWKKVEDE